MTNLWQEFHGPNAGYVLELYSQYRTDPASVDPTTRAYFERWSPPAEGGENGHYAAPALPMEKIVGVINLAQAIREFGYLAAQLDPLGGVPIGDPALDPAFHGITLDDLRALPASLIGGPVGRRAANAYDAISELRSIYQSTTGFDYGHVRVPAEREWLREAIESGRFHPPHDPIDQQALLHRLTEVEVFERFLHRAFPGKTRFSIEGLDMLVPILDELVGDAAEMNIHHITMGMAHRGRLNVLAHVLNKPYEQILAEFKDPVKRAAAIVVDDEGFSGDVKYHHGARRALKGGAEVDVMVSMVPNPSHLEFVNPVVLGMVRAAGTDADQAGPSHFDEKITMAVLIHGDAAFPGQGIVAETLNFARLAGYNTGGTLHIIANNQIGFTTQGYQSYSSLFSSDIAKGYKVPIIHVNADDPEACIAAVRLALVYRAEFGKDVLVDLIGYRRHGHNEGDDPSFTQPLVYEVVNKHPTVRELWARTLEQRGQLNGTDPEALVQQRMQHLQGIMAELEPEEDLLEPQLDAPPPGAAKRVKTRVELDRLLEMQRALVTPPEGFRPHSKLDKALSRRREALQEGAEQVLDWAAAEELAYASILADGTPIRLTGQDVERGTFSHRHAVLHDERTDERWLPLHTLPQARASLEIANSPLTENAVLGFEYGYNVQAPERLVLWEAQYGDFVNGAQVIIDEFIVSGRAKWAQTPSLVMLLPHGYEGQGPDHASGRPERFLQLAAETNMRIANCTTAAQYFHLLRRQAALLKTDPLPLVVFTPKSLLRQKLAMSPLRDLAEGAWQPVIDDAERAQEAAKVKRLVLCSGKVYVDLVTSEHRAAHPEVALVRVEQLYPFPSEPLTELLGRYAALEEVLWVQEEPQNQGAWTFVEPRLRDLLGGTPLRYLGRPPRSSPAEGSAAWHNVNQRAIVERAFM